jgi:ATP-dependent Clp protease ATP-binding subunit ClpB
LTDGQGRTVDFRNSIVVMTSNIASDIIADEKKSEKERHDAVLLTMKSYFRPEFINRIDDTIIFNSLKKEVINDIVKIQLQAVRERMSEKKINIEIDDKAVAYLGRKGFDPIFGARPLRRVIQTDLLDTLAKHIISGDLHAGGTAKITASDLSLEIKVRKS